MAQPRRGSNGSHFVAQLENAVCFAKDCECFENTELWGQPTGNLINEPIARFDEEIYSTSKPNTSTLDSTSWVNSNRSMFLNHN
jgi:hypothetical protein